MTILAFLQNMWVKHPDQWKEFFEKHPEKWNAMVKSLLLDNNCRTGRMIKGAFGELAKTFIYDECTKEIAWNSKTVCEPDLKHIEDTIKRIKPDIIITFGLVAKKAVLQSTYNIEIEDLKKIKFIHSPHPACRRMDTIKKLKKACEELKKLL